MVQPGDMESDGPVRNLTATTLYQLKYQRFSGIPCLPHRVSAMTQVRKDAPPAAASAAAAGNPSTRDAVLAASPSAHAVAITNAAAATAAAAAADLRAFHQPALTAAAIEAKAGLDGRGLDRLDHAASPSGARRLRSFLPVPRSRYRTETKCDNPTPPPPLARHLSADGANPYDRLATVSGAARSSPADGAADVGGRPSLVFRRPVGFAAPAAASAEAPAPSAPSQPPLASPRLSKSRSAGASGNGVGGCGERAATATSPVAAATRVGSESPRQQLAAGNNASSSGGGSSCFTTTATAVSRLPQRESLGCCGMPPLAANGHLVSAAACFDGVTDAVSLSSSSSYVGSEATECSAFASAGDPFEDDDNIASSIGRGGDDRGCSDVHDDDDDGATLTSLSASHSASGSCRSGCSRELDDGADAPEAETDGGGSCSYFYDDEFGGGGCGGEDDAGARRGATKSSAADPSLLPGEGALVGGDAEGDANGSACGGVADEVPAGGERQWQLASGVSCLSTTFDDILCDAQLPAADAALSGDVPGDAAAASAADCRIRSGGSGVADDSGADSGSTPDFFSLPEKRHYTLAFGGASLLGCSDSSDCEREAALPYDSNGNLTSSSADGDESGCGGGNISNLRAGFGRLTVSADVPRAAAAATSVAGAAAAKKGVVSSPGGATERAADARTPADAAAAVAAPGAGRGRSDLRSPPNGDGSSSCGSDSVEDGEGVRRRGTQGQGRVSPKRVSFVELATATATASSAAMAGGRGAVVDPSDVRRPSAAASGAAAAAADLDAMAQSATWQQLKRNYTTWGQVRAAVRQQSPRKSRSVADMKSGERIEQPPAPDGTSEADGGDDDAAGYKRYSLTLFEIYKRTHSLSSDGESASGSLTSATSVEAGSHGLLQQIGGSSSSEVFTVERREADASGNAAEQQRSLPTAAAAAADCSARPVAPERRPLAPSPQPRLTQAAAAPPKPHPHCAPDTAGSNVCADGVSTPDLSFLRPQKGAILATDWWRDILEQPSFCAEADFGEPPVRRRRCCCCLSACSARAAERCRGGHMDSRANETIIVVNNPRSGTGAAAAAARPQKCSGVCCSSLSLQPQRKRQATDDDEDDSDLSSGIATGSSGATPRDGGHCFQSRSTLPEASPRSKSATVRKTNRGGEDAPPWPASSTTMPATAPADVGVPYSDHRLIVLLSCMEAADVLVRHFDRGVTASPTTKPANGTGACSSELLRAMWSLALAVESIVMLGLRDLAPVTTRIGKVMARLSAWDVAVQSAAGAGSAARAFASAVEQASGAAADGPSHRFCLFICSLVATSCLDFWLQSVQHDSALLDRCYRDDAFFRRRTLADRKLSARLAQALQPLSACSAPVDAASLVQALSSAVSGPDSVDHHENHTLTPTIERCSARRCPVQDSADASRQNT